MTGENAGKKKPTRLMPGGCWKILRRYPHPGVCLQQQSTVERIRILEIEYAAPKFTSNQAVQWWLMKPEQGTATSSWTSRPPVNIRLSVEERRFSAA